MRAWAWPGALFALGACLGPVAAWAGDEPKSAAAVSRDAGQAQSPAPNAPSLSKEDQEVLQNLELLENLDESRDLDLLQELTRK